MAVYVDIVKRIFDSDLVRRSMSHLSFKGLDTGVVQITGSRGHGRALVVCFYTLRLRGEHR